MPAVLARHVRYTGQLSLPEIANINSHIITLEKTVTKHSAVSTAPTGHTGITQAAYGDTDIAFLQKSLTQAEGRLKLIIES